MFDSMFKNITLADVLWFTFYLFLILAANGVVRGMIAFLSGKAAKLPRRFVPTIQALVNWMSFYGALLLFLFYFSKTQWLFYPIYSVDGQQVTLFLIIVAIMIVTLAHRLVKLFAKYVLTNLYEYYDVDKSLGYTFNQIIYYTVMIAALAVSLTNFGLDLTALGAIFGALGIGLGFGLRNIAGNFVSGIIVLFERPVKIGEVIQVQDKVGRVEKIRLRSTVVRTAKEGTLIVPNQYFIEQIVKNRTGAEMMAQVEVSVTYRTDSEMVEQWLHEAVSIVKERENGILEQPAPDIRFIDFRNRAMVFLIEIPVKNFEIKELVESRLRHAISKCFKGHDVELAGLDFFQAALKKPDA
ncbi:mechanosensitive ion channel family protein [Mesobacillus foraminis]|uniref:mechanosensitive ion channel family protein n=1 Tax=Mesobacillus foraminis TaxID=279826 RepID=UPI000EF4B170|nr:mechanosensitive ion channel domain-containing protein [Mesobacillus foraminis]